MSLPMLVDSADGGDPTRVTRDRRGVKVVAGPSTVVAAGDTILIVESMKMEIPVESPEDGTVTVLQVGEGDQVSEDDPVATVETA